MPLPFEALSPGALSSGMAAIEAGDGVDPALVPSLSGLSTGSTLNSLMLDLGEYQRRWRLVEEGSAEQALCQSGR